MEEFFIRQLAGEFFTLEVVDSYRNELDETAWELVIDNEELVNRALQVALNSLKEEFLERLHQSRLQANAA